MAGWVGLDVDADDGVMSNEMDPGMRADGGWWMVDGVMG